MKEIGGYLELEELSGEEYYTDMIRLNLGRTALQYLCMARGCRTLMLPYYLCDSVIRSCEQIGISVEYYHIDNAFSPQLPEKLSSDTYLYLVNYYGQLTDESILEYKRKYSRIIVDHTHAFFQKPIPGIDTIYSCRKFFGLPDGAYLSADLPQRAILEKDISVNRMEHLLGRYEVNASSYYKIMLNNASSFNDELPKAMSRITQNLLKGIDYSQVIEKRNSNYAYLASQLDKYNCVLFNKPEAPFTYPFYFPQGKTLRKIMASYKIYIPTYWNNVIQNSCKDSIEYDYASNILPLPCDQRYSREDMKDVVRILISSIKDLEKKQ